MNFNSLYPLEIKLLLLISNIYIVKRLFFLLRHNFFVYSFYLKVEMLKVVSAIYTKSIIHTRKDSIKTLFFTFYETKKDWHQKLLFLTYL